MAEVIELSEAHIQIFLAWLKNRTDEDQPEEGLVFTGDMCWDDNKELGFITTSRGILIGIRRTSDYDLTPPGAFDVVFEGMPVTNR